MHCINFGQKPYCANKCALTLFTFICHFMSKEKIKIDLALTIIFSVESHAATYSNFK